MNVRIVARQPDQSSDAGGRPVHLAPAVGLDVLFVEDEADNRLVLLAMFRSRFTCRAVADAAAALAVLEAQPVAVLVTDQHMPGRTGVELCAEVGQRWPDVRRIVLTADLERQAVVDAINVGRVHAFVDKPWDVEALEQLLRLHVAEVCAARAHQALQAAMASQERLASAANLRQALLHDLATAAGIADLGYDALIELVEGLEGQIDDDELQDARAGLHALRDGLDYIGQLQAELRSASRVSERSPEPIELLELLRQACALAGQPQGVLQQIDVAPDVPTHIFADRVAVTRILINLLRNASEALVRVGGGSIRLRALLEPRSPSRRPAGPDTAAAAASPAPQPPSPAARHPAEPTALWIVVEDDGPGVAEADRARLFHQGFSTRPDGAGIGLATSRDLALREGGELWLDASQEGSGARFVLRLPMSAGVVAP